MTRTHNRIGTEIANARAYLELQHRFTDNQQRVVNNLWRYLNSPDVNQIIILADQLVYAIREAFTNVKSWAPRLRKLANEYCLISAQRDIQQRFATLVAACIASTGSIGMDTARWHKDKDYLRQMALGNAQLDWFRDCVVLAGAELRVRYPDGQYAPRDGEGVVTRNAGGGYPGVKARGL